MSKYKSFKTIDPDLGLQSAEVTIQDISDLIQNDIIIKVLYSSINYKDALSANGNKSISKKYPHTPGIDAAGIVVKSNSDKFKVNDQVLVTGFDLGMNTPGGLSEYISVPSDWPILLPKNLSPLEAMALGTAGLTAAMCIHKLIQNGITKELGKILVSGASGGVGSIAIGILSKLQFECVAISSKKEAESYIKNLGAKEFILANEFNEPTTKPLLAPNYIAGIDCLGGITLSNMLKQIKYNGAVSACGMALNPEFSSSVFPFILRGISLFGIDSVAANLEIREHLWNLLSNKWKPNNLIENIKIIELEEVKSEMLKMLANKQQGRIIVKL